MDYQSRLSNLKKRLQQQEIGILALLPGANFTYITGIAKELSERPFVLFIPSSESARPTVLLPRLEVETFLDSVSYQVDLVTYTDEEGYSPAFIEACNNLDGQKAVIGVEARAMRFLELRQIQQNAPEISIVEADEILSISRMQKDENEIDAIRNAIRVSELALEATCAQVRPGMAERNVQMILSMEMLKNGADGHGFSPIVLSGPRAALPHGVAGERRLQKGDCLLIDFGFRVGNYSADITRTFSIGTPSPEWKKIYDIVKAANKAGHSVAKPGIAAEEVDFAARKVIEDAGYGKYFNHRTGHGLGLDIHEPPYIVSGNKTTLQPGMVFTIEPGIYLAEKVGVRIEDDVMITQDKAESLTTFPRELIVL
jgi:Xaa-Pro dipeptidase